MHLMMQPMRRYRLKLTALAYNSILHPERMRIDSSGNLLVGDTSTFNDTAKTGLVRHLTTGRLSLVLSIRLTAQAAMATSWSFTKRQAPRWGVLGQMVH